MDGVPANALPGFTVENKQITKQIEMNIKNCRKRAIMLPHPFSKTYIIVTD